MKMKTKKIMMLIVLTLLVSCSTSNLAVKKVKYEVVSASAISFKNNKPTSYNAIILIGKQNYQAILDNKLNIVDILKKEEVNE